MGARCDSGGLGLTTAGRIGGLPDEVEYGEADTPLTMRSRFELVPPPLWAWASAIDIDRSPYLGRAEWDTGEVPDEPLFWCRLERCHRCRVLAMLGTVFWVCMRTENPEERIKRLLAMVLGIIVVIGARAAKVTFPIFSRLRWLDQDLAGERLLL